MRQELDDLLCKQYPKIFAQRHGKPSDTAMCWGFDIGDGWYNLVDTLCQSIQREIDWSRERRCYGLRRYRICKRISKTNDYTELASYLIYRDAVGPQLVPGDFEYARAIYDSNEWLNIREAIPQVVAVQVKQKFGGLRFYCVGGNTEIRAMIHFAESLSEKICEECGSPGSQNDSGYIRTLCCACKTKR